MNEFLPPILTISHTFKSFNSPYIQWLFSNQPFCSLYSIFVQSILYENTVEEIKTKYGVGEGNLSIKMNQYLKNFPMYYKTPESVQIRENMNNNEQIQGRPCSEKESFDINTALSSLEVLYKSLFNQRKIFDVQKVPNRRVRLVDNEHNENSMNSNKISILREGLKSCQSIPPKINLELENKNHTSKEMSILSTNTLSTYSSKDNSQEDSEIEINACLKTDFFY